MLLPVVSLVAGVRVAPLLLAVAAGLLIIGVGLPLLASVVTVSLLLAPRLATYNLLGVITRWLEGLLAIAAQDGRQAESSDSHHGPVACSSGKEDLESAVES